MAKVKRIGMAMIGPLEKGMEQAKVVTPPRGTYEGVDLRVLPKYIAFRAALLRTQLSQQYMILVLATLLIGYFALSRQEVYRLNERLRLKEYILAPGVADFTPAAPQSVSEHYVEQAVSDFVSQLGNVTPGSIDDQYLVLSGSMSRELRVKFLAEAGEWKSKVKADRISELLTITDKSIQSSGDGSYRAVIHAKRDRYLDNQYVGQSSEVIEMELRLVPPQNAKRWYLEIQSLSRQSPEAFRSKKEVK
ncbi:hypothetical protein WDW86_05045 [Bdellovibrionota bacterium FG-2]